MAAQVGLSPTGVLDICQQFAAEGAPGLVSKPRGRKPDEQRHDCSGCFRLEHLPGGTCTHGKAPPCHGAHPDRTLNGSSLARETKRPPLGDDLLIIRAHPASRHDPAYKGPMVSLRILKAVALSA
ncbi:MULTISPECIES: hypothetical protein [Microvirga]|uniref:hypothetical protein n=1 Tax=Microvirga TaxID=186650 RepID=UPI0035305625